MNDTLSDEKKLYHVLQSIPVAIHSCCLNARRENDSMPCQCGDTIINDTMSRLTGYAKRDIELRFHNRISEMVIPEDRADYLCAIDELYEYPHEKQLVFRVEKKNGEVIAVREKVSSVRHADGSIWLYAVTVEAKDEPVGHCAQEDPRSDKRVVIQTFGYFNVLIDGRPVAFQHEKSKELMALLVDREGKFVSSSEIISCLWEDEPVNDNTRSRCRKASFYLRETLAEYGLEDLIESTSRGYRRIRTEMVDCDLYRHLSGHIADSKRFRGAYLSDYSWAEQTLSRLTYERSR